MNQEEDNSREAEIHRRSAPSAKIIHATIRREGEEDLERTTPALAWSGLAAGLSMGFSFLVESLLHAALPEASWRSLVSSFGYSLGFLFVILGRQQLFTEKTLNPILPLLHRTHSIWRVARLWGIVLGTNMAGTGLFGLFLAHVPLFDASVHAAFQEVASGVVELEFWGTFCSAILAGWLVAIMVWLLPFAESARVLVIIIVTWVIGIGGFSHIVASSTEAAYLVFTGRGGLAELWMRFWLPTLLGNIFGGVVLVAALNHAQVVAGKKS